MALSLRNFRRSVRRRLGWPRGSLRLRDLVRDGRVDPAIGVTTGGRNDGGGAQIQGAMSALNFAAALGLRYVHTPLATVAHGEGEPDWARRWEEFFSLGAGETVVDATRDRIVTLKEFVADRALWRDPRVVVSCLHYHEFADRDPDGYRAILPALRRKYALSDKGGPKSEAAAGVATVAVHMRRGDVRREIHADRFSGDDRVLRTIAETAAACRALSLPFRIELYSQGDPASFRRFVDAGCVLRLNEDVFATIDRMVRADILVMAKSSFSYVPALLGDGIKLYERFWHPPLSDWIARDAKGGFDRARLGAALRLKKF